jgi:hypothetical protein
LPEEVKQEEPANSDEPDLYVTEAEDALEKGALRTIKHIYHETKGLSDEERRRVRFLNWSTVLHEFYRYEGDFESLLEACSICHTDYEEDDRVVACPAKHYFHHTCLLPFLQEKGKCAFCKRSLVPLNS